jgi:quercetin dioxygenase-like cupin family protein
MEFDTKHHFSSGVYIKQMSLNAGYYVETHEHNYDHFSLLGAGSALVELDGEVKTFLAPTIIEIRAGKRHKITALTDIDWFCIHATTVTDAKLVDEVLIRKD